ncbi:MAG: DNA mismatch repair endonuclease MutL, partial [bacterium]
VRLIAAGEVIERPASVVKELIENSLDARSTEISVIIVNGGLSSIIVRDNGTGIPSKQVGLLTERHTTSKISTEADLDAILTLGFRGEALYSMASAGDLVMSTRFVDEEIGSRLTARNDEKKVEEISWPGGTQVEVVNLFHSTPARRKFLRSSSAEFSKIAEIVSAYALAYPAHAWRLYHNDREILRTTGSGKLEDALLAVYGADIVRRMLTVDFAKGPVSISGAVSAADTHRARRTAQTIFLNGRLIKDPSILAALEQAYGPFIPKGRHPIAMLDIRCDPGELDVNVHPHKREVRMANPRMITGSVYRAVENALQRDRTVSNSAVAPNPLPVKDFSIDELTGEVMEIQTGQSKQSARLTEIADDDSWAIRQGKRHHTSEIPGPVIPDDSAPKLRRKVENKQHEYPSFADLEIIENSDPVASTLQFADTYLVYVSGSEIYLVDQHNLHERILFEELNRRESETRTVSQALLFPMQVNLTPSLAALVKDHIEELNRLGFDIEEFSSETIGGQSFVLRAVPSELSEGDPARVFLDCIERVSQDENISSPGEFRKSFITNLACKSAIKAGKKLTESEIGFLLKHIDNPTFLTCPHGRPTVIRLDEEWFKNAFKRS